MTDFAALGFRLARLRALTLASRRARKADPCEILRALPPDADACDILPCFKRDVDGEGPMWSVAPELMCDACRRNGERAARESQLRRQAGNALAALTRAGRAILEASLD